MRLRETLTPEQISVVIPALNEAEHLAEAIESCRKTGIREIIVSDGGSEDSTQEIASRSGARLIVSPKGRGLQISAGVEHTTKPVIAFLHADNRFTRECGEVLCQRYSTSKAEFFWGGFHLLKLPAN